MLKKVRSFFRSHTLFVELLGVFIITIPAFISLLNPSYFAMHDTQHVARLFLLDKGIHQGYLFPRWVDTLGFNFGYPLFNFYPPLVYYVGEFFHLLGLSFTQSIKAVFITGFLAGGWGIYLLAKKHLGRYAGLLATVLYTYFFYHAVLIYVRGALAEFFTLAILPYVFLALDNLRLKLSAKSAVVFGIVFALLVLNHPLIAVPFLFYLIFTYIFYLIIMRKNRLRLTMLLTLGGLIGLALSAFFWLPSMAERGYTLVDAILTHELADYRVHFVCFSQFLNSPWGFGGSIPGCFDGFTFQLGKIHLALILMAGVTAFWYGTRKERVSLNFEHFTYFLFLLLFSLFMTTDSSTFIWDKVSYLWYLQFPWRFFTFTALFISLTGAFGLHYLQRILSSYHVKPKKVSFIQGTFLIIVTILTIAVYQKYFHPTAYVTADDRVYTNFYEIADRVSRTSFEFAPKGVKTAKNEYNTTTFDLPKDQISKESFKITAGAMVVQPTINKFADKEFRVSATHEGTFRLNTFSFPGWTYYLDGKKQRIYSDNPYRLIHVHVPEGDHVLSFRFENTPVRTVADAISIVSLVAVLLFFGLKFKEAKL